MQLNREQIIRALEFCGICECNNEKTNTECALINMPFCKNYLRNQALALIEELTKESQKWEQAYDCADSACRELSSKCDELTEKKEEYCRECAELRVVLYEITDEVNQIKADVVKKIQDRLAMRFGTYTDKTEVKVMDVFKLMSQIAEEMLED
jgi:uncharacterized coiled-coil DUF342 family protein